jgi:winged helix DNA-binding protein
VHLAQTGTLCFGPIRDDEQQLVLLEEWVPKPRRLERDEALGELALRYFRGHGPATAKDFGRWAKLVAADVRTGLALARPDLEPLDLDGVEYLMDPQTPARLDSWRDAARGVFLLPGFDEYMLGYGDRSAALPPRFAERIVPGGNGVFQPTVVADGQVVGTWRRIGRAGARTLQVTPFEPLADPVTLAVPEVFEQLPV